MQTISRAAIVLIAASLAAPSLLVAEDPAVPSREERCVAGWTVHVSTRLLQDEPEHTAKALELLESQLEEIIRVVPKKAVAQLQEVHLWMSPVYPGTRPKAEYHPSARWLRDNGRDEAMAQCVEFTNIEIFEAETRRMPNFALHELAHAYHDRVLGHDQPDIRAAFAKASAAGTYDRVEQRLGDGRSKRVRAYAMSNAKEYFAETTEAFFSRNDFYPFTRGQLARHDPEMCRVLAKVWGTAEKGAEPSAAGESMRQKTAAAEAGEGAAADVP